MDLTVFLWSAGGFAFVDAMRQAIDILIQSRRMLFFNAGLIARYVLLGAVGGLVLSAALTIILMAVTSGAKEIPLTTIYTLSIIFTLLALLFFLPLCALSWHRHVLLKSESDTLLPPSYLGLAVPYYEACTKVTFSLVLILIVPSVIAVSLSTELLDRLLIDGAKRVDFVVISFPILVALALATYAFLRLGIYLPATAVENTDLTVWDSWEATVKMNSVIWWLTGVITLLNWLAWLVLFLPFHISIAPYIGSMPVVVIFAVVAYFWFAYLFTISIITTLYGICVERREI